MSLSQPAMSLEGERRPIIFHMVLNMDETRLKTIFQLRGFLAGTLEVLFCAPGNDEERYACIVAVAQRFSYARFNRP